MKTHFASKVHGLGEAPGRRSGQALIGLLVAGLIMIGLYMMFLGPTRGKDGKPGKSIPKQSMERAKEVGGDSNLRQIGMCLDSYKSDNNGQVPADLPALKAYCKEIPAPMWVDPLDGRPYLYDPQSGTVYSPNGPPPAGVAAAPGAPAAAPAAPQPAAPAPLPGNRGPGGVRLPDMQPQAPVDADQ